MADRTQTRVLGAAGCLGGVRATAAGCRALRALSGCNVAALLLWTGQHNHHSLAAVWAHGAQV